MRGGGLNGTGGKVRRLGAGGVLLACLLALPGQAAADGTQTLSVADVSKNETAGTLEFTVKLSAGPDSATFDYTIEDGGASDVRAAEDGKDYTKVSKTEEAIAAEGEVKIVVPILADILDEAEEALTLKISNITNTSNAGGLASAVGRIQDDPDDLPPFATIENTNTDGAVVEGSPAAFAVRLSAPSGRPVSVTYRTVDVSAFADSDYTAIEPGTAAPTIPAGQLMSAAISIATTDDQNPEADETFKAVLGDPNETARIGTPNEAQVTIRDNETLPTLSIEAAQVTEVDTGNNAVDITFKVKLSAKSAREVNVTATTADGTAVAPADYQSGTRRLRFVANDQEELFVVKVNGDNLDEASETFKVFLSDTDGATIAVSEATGTIVDNDNNSKLSISDAAADEPGAGSAAMKFTVNLAPASDREVKVNWGTSDGTASAPSDYTSGSGELRFAPGETAKMIEIAVAGDTINEENETLKVTLSSPSGVPLANIVDPEGLGTIVDKNAPPTLSISDPLARESEGAKFTVTLAGTTLRTVTVRFSTADGGGKAGSDYASRVGSLTFAPGEKSKTIEVTVLDDAVSEPNEDFFVVLDDAVNATITKARGRASIEASDQVAAPPTPPVTPPKTPVVGKPTTVLVPRMILGPRTVSVGPNGIARMLVTCQKASPIGCAGSVELQRAGKPLLRLGKRAFSVKKGAKGYASIKLTTRGLAALRKNRTLRAKVVVIVKTSAKSMKVSPGIIVLKSVKTVAKPKPKPPTTTKVVVDP